MDIVFKIKDISCSYDPENTILEIKELDIKRGGLYFFIGSSGVGKSTLLETLGLMNNTVHKSVGEISYYKEDGMKIDLRSIWRESDDFISNFRQHEYSFIFQNTNLMPHFTAGENMMYTMLIEGKPYQEAELKVKELMEQVGLPIDLFDRPIFNISGGQRQRLAFVRAFVSEFNVLFGDEPTGNLDPHTAYTLMSILKSHIKMNNKTAIIVSHDIQLASNFADGIFCLTKKENDFGKSMGLIGKNNYLENSSSGWYKDDKLVQGNIIEVLNSYL